MRHGSPRAITDLVAETLVVGAGLASGLFGARLLVFTESHVMGWILVFVGLCLWILGPMREALMARPKVRSESAHATGLQLGSIETDARIVCVAIPRSLFRLLRFRPFPVLAGTLVGGSITAVPALLFELGQENASFMDWRVVSCFAVTFFIPLVYIKLGGLVMQAVLNEPVGSSAGGSSDKLEVHRGD